MGIPIYVIALVILVVAGLIGIACLVYMAITDRKTLFGLPDVLAEEGVYQAV